MREINIEKIKDRIRTDQPLLTAFTLQRTNNKYLYMVFGDYEIDTVKEDDYIHYETVGENEKLKFLSEKLEFPYPEFYGKKLEGYKLDLETDEISLIDCEDLGERWIGEPFTIYDVPSSACAAYTQEDSTCSVQYLEDGLKKILDSPVYEKALMNGKEIPLRMLNSDMDVMQLLMATNKYLYMYEHDDIFKMINVDTLETVSDNYFAEEGFEDSKENIESGEEKLIWIHPYEAKCHGLEKFISRETDNGENKRFENIDYKKLSSNKNVESQRTKENTIEQK
ncbi:MAG: hypothetical protein JTJ21_07935 [Holdemanella sp.]|nr:hypothetical protein [Holdemanella sp.]